MYLQIVKRLVNSLTYAFHLICLIIAIIEELTYDLFILLIYYNDLLKNKTQKGAFTYLYYLKITLVDGKNKFVGGLNSILE